MLSEEKNLKLLEERISELNLRGNIVISFDFDELVVPIHLTREVAQRISKPVDKKILNEFGSNSFQRIRYLNSLMHGYDFEKYKQIRDETAKKTKWTERFDNLLKILIEDYSVIFVSSGIKDVCESKLKELAFDSRNILGNEFRIENGYIKGSDLIISDKLKGYITNEIKKDYRVIAIGHSEGDKMMLDNADVGISVNSTIPNLAEYNVNSAGEILEIVKKYSDQNIKI